MEKKKKLRWGFTTGSCATAAAKAAAYMLLTGKEKKHIVIHTPKGIDFSADILEIQREERSVRCAVRKDGGDDPDVTTGSLIYAGVSLEQAVPGEEKILIEGGEGVGRVTKPGLDQPVGNAAINSVPRQMITEAVSEIMALCDFGGRLRVQISVPGGELLAQKTFNPRLGIQGGISILGTSGVVEPMSEKALKDTILWEIRQKKALGCAVLPISPGNYGLRFMKERYGYDLDQSVKCSNFIGETLDMARENGFHKVLLTGHVGKLVKVAGGIMNTHSREADARMELLAAMAIPAGVPLPLLSEILAAVNTEEALAVLDRAGKRQEVMDRVAERACFYLRKRAGDELQVELILYSNMYGELAKSEGAEELLSGVLPDTVRTANEE